MRRDKATSRRLRGRDRPSGNRSRPQLHREIAMHIHKFVYAKPDLISLSWVCRATGMDAARIGEAIRTDGFPSPTPNHGRDLLWDRREVLAWLDAAGVRKTLRPKISRNAK
jgi:predicted DNA-binding transcriptional regulator AlpA